MTSIERTAYPRFSQRQQFSKQWLYDNFALQDEDYQILYRERAINDSHKLCMALQLKVFQYLGYFFDLKEVPGAVVKTIRDSLGFTPEIKAVYNQDRTKYRHRDHIREKLSVTKWRSIPKEKNADTQRLCIEFSYGIAFTMNNPADILNATLEFMRSYNYEIPAFSTIDRLIRHVRHVVNTKIYANIYWHLQQSFIIPCLDKMIQRTDGYNRTEYNRLKELPCKPTITNLYHLIKHHDWLSNLGNINEVMDKISHIKLSQFAEYAISQDVSDIREMNNAKKYSLTAILIYHAQRETKDALAATFCKTVFKLHADAKRELERLKDLHAKTTQNIAEMLERITEDVDGYDGKQHKKLAENIIAHYNTYDGGIAKVASDCKKVAAYNSKNHLPLVWQYFKPKRAALFKLLEVLNIQSATQNNYLINAMNLVIENKTRRSEHVELVETINISFASQDWRKLVYDRKESPNMLNRRNLEACVFSCLAMELKCGDIYVEGSNSYSDYRKKLLPWEICKSKLSEFCKRVEIPEEKSDFINGLKVQLSTACHKLDTLYPELNNLYIDEDGYPRLKRTIKNNPKSSPLLEEIKRRMPDRNLLDMMCNAQQYTGWADEFGPLSGSEPKIKNAVEKYIINAFSGGTGMGPTQTARHVKADNLSAHVLSKINRRHVNVKKLNQAMTKLINYGNSFSVTHLLGDKEKCSVDGTLRNIFDDNLLAETHYRYRNKGAIAYHHISDTYIALFSTFIPCGVWEAVEIIESLMKNESDIQPHIIHGDTQGQSSIVFGLSYLLGVKLMPRIRNFKGLKFYKANANTVYKNIENLFDKNVIDWDILETHWQDLMQVVISIQEGTLSSSLLLRKLTNNSKKNKLFKAFRELGNVIRTLFLLEYILDEKLRDGITESTNKVEAFNGLSEWCTFGSKYIVDSNDPNEMEKALKYNTIVANCIIIQNLVDISSILFDLKSEGWEITKNDVKKLRPYLTEHIKRFGDYIFQMVSLSSIPDEIRYLKVA